MSPSRKREELDVESEVDPATTNNEDEDDSDADDDADNEKEEMISPTAVTSSSRNNLSKVKCLKCHRAARKDCTGSLCIRCCTDETCAVHEEQRAKARWKESVIAGKTEIQLAAKAKRARAIPKGRFKEREFNYMNDTVVLWDLRTVLEPSPPVSQSAAVASTDGQRQTGGTPLHSSSSPGGNTSTTTTAPTANVQPSSSSSSISASAIAKYNNDLKIKEEILRRSRKNNSHGERESVVDVRRDYRRNTKRFRSVIEDLYQRSLN